MQINLGTTVMTADGQDIGKIDRLVVDPRTDRMQEFVVRKGFFVPHDIIIPIGEVDEAASDADSDNIHLRMTADAVQKLPAFEEYAYVAAPDGLYPGGLGMPLMGGTAAYGGGYLWPDSPYEAGGRTQVSTGENPAVSPPGTMDAAMEESRPNSVFINTGTDVKTRGGDKVGTVDELVVDQARGKVTAIVVKQGLFGNKHVRIPAQLIDEIDADAVYVTGTKESLERYATDA